MNENKRSVWLVTLLFQPAFKIVKMSNKTFIGVQKASRACRKLNLTANTQDLIMIFKVIILSLVEIINLAQDYKFIYAV